MKTHSNIFIKHLIDHGFKYCSDNPITYVRIDKELSTKLFVFIYYEGGNGTKIAKIVFSLHLELPIKTLGVDEEFDPIFLGYMATHQSNWYEMIVAGLCQKINRFYLDTLSKCKQNQE